MPFWRNDHPIFPKRVGCHELKHVSLVNQSRITKKSAPVKRGFTDANVDVSFCGVRYTVNALFISVEKVGPCCSSSSIDSGVSK